MTLCAVCGDHPARIYRLRMLCRRCRKDEMLMALKVVIADLKKKLRKK